MTQFISRLSQEFRERFRGEPTMLVAPGRINLIGEHVDYNDGFVLPAAIDKQLGFAFAQNGTDRFTIYSTDFRESASFELTELKIGSHWINYLMGVAEGFKRRGIRVNGMDCVFGGTIPVGAGLSSSAALCCGFALAINHLHQANLSLLDMARIAQFSEHEFAGVKCGLMDQYAVLFGEKESLLLLDCRTMTHETVAFSSSSCSILLVDTKVKHVLSSSAYNDRRSSCEESVSILQKSLPGIRALRDVSMQDLEQRRELLSPTVFARCKFVLEETTRTQRAAKALTKNDLRTFGSLMFQSHEGLRRDYEVSCPELDFLVDLAARNPKQVIGARLMGGGFGGCTINLVQSGEEESFRLLVSTEYFTFFRQMPEIYQVTISGGAHLIP